MNEARAEQVTDQTTTVSDENSTISITANPSTNRSDLYVSTLVANRLLDLSDDNATESTTASSTSTTESDNITLSGLRSGFEQSVDSNDTDTSANTTVTVEDSENTNENGTTEIAVDETTTEAPPKLRAGDDSQKVDVTTEQ